MDIHYFSERQQYRKRRLFRTELDNYRASKRSSDNLTTNFASKNIENFQSVQKFDQSVQNFQLTRVDDFQNVDNFQNRFSENLIENESICFENDTYNKCELSDFQLKSELASLVSQYNVPAQCVNKILALLNKKKCISLPMDCRTLMNTPRKNEISMSNNSQFLYFGLEKQISSTFDYLNISFQNNVNFLKLEINTDGVCYSDNAKSTFWPISIAIPSISVKPIVIACYHGTSKPSSVHDFFDQFVKEFAFLQQTGFEYKNKKFFISSDGNKLVCDTPARAFAIGSRGHNFTYACTRCKVLGRKINNRMCFLQIENLNMRTSYDNDFFVTESPLLKINLNLINDSILDSMHLVYLGVTKKFLNLLVTNEANQKISDTNLETLNCKIQHFSKFVPTEFARKLRPLSFISRWKATEWRQFLLYIGPIVLKDCVSADIYRTFLTLHIAIRILNSESLHMNTALLSYAGDLLENFVKNFQNIFGLQFCGFNVHNLLHLVEDVKRFGSLDSYSCFKFENYYSIFRKKIMPCGNHLAQFANRLHETHKIICRDFEKSFPKLTKPCDRKNDNSPLLGLFYKELRLVNFAISITENDNCLILKDNSYCIVNEIFSINNKISITYLVINK